MGEGEEWPRLSPPFLPTSTKMQIYVLLISYVSLFIPWKGFFIVVNPALESWLMPPTGKPHSNRTPLGVLNPEGGFMLRS